MRDFANFSCLNCRYGGAKYHDDSETHTDGEYARLLCTKFVSIVRLDLQFVCAEWVHEETSQTIEDIRDKFSWNLPQDVIDKIESNDTMWSVEDIKELLDESK